MFCFFKTRCLEACAPKNLDPDMDKEARTSSVVGR